MPETHRPPTISIHGPDGLLSVIPALIGFHPTDSLVLVCLNGHPRCRVGPVMRVDLPRRIDPDWVEQIAASVHRHAEIAVLVVYTDAPPPDLTRLVAAIDAAIPVEDVLITSNAPHPVADAIAAANLETGRVTLPSRAALAASVNHQPALNPDAAAPILARLGTVAGRDRFLTAALHDPDHIAELITAAQATPDTDPRIPDLCSVLAVLAYRHGDGALAQVAIDRTLRIDSTHRLAHLMLAAMAAGLPPAELVHLAAPDPRGGGGPGDCSSRPTPNRPLPHPKCQKGSTTMIPTHPTPGNHPTTPAANFYGRADAIADGLLVEVPKRLTDLFRIPWPLAVTAGVWADVIAWPPTAQLQKPQGWPRETETGRITDLLWMARTRWETDPNRRHLQTFTLWRVPPTGPDTRQRRVRLTLTIHPGDCGDTVATIAHEHHPAAGRFHLAAHPDTSWDAAAFDTTPGAGRIVPVVAARVLDEMLDDAAQLLAAHIEAHYGGNDIVHVTCRQHTATLIPTPAGLYRLGALPWTFHRS